MKFREYFKSLTVWLILYSTVHKHSTIEVSDTSEEDELLLVLGGDTGVVKSFSDASHANSRYAPFLRILKDADIVAANLECALTD